MCPSIKYIRLQNIKPFLKKTVCFYNSKLTLALFKMNKTILVYGSLYVLFSACNTPPPIQTLSETEINGRNAVSDIFASSIQTSRTYSASSSAGIAQIFTLRIDSLIPMFGPYKEDPIILTSNAALLFYKCLSEEEKHQFTQIHIILPYDTKGMDTYMYSVGMLDTLMGKMTLIEKVIHCVVNEDYDGLFSNLDHVMDDSAKKSFQEVCRKSSIPLMGLSESYYPLGFIFYNRDGERTYGRFYAFLKGKSEDLKFEVDFCMDPKIGKISGLSFKHDL